MDFMEEVESEREYDGYYYSLGEALSIVVLGSLCGLKNVSQIHQWAESERTREWLKEKFAIERIPCYYWLLSLLKMVKPESLNQCLSRWVRQMLPEEREGLTLAVDGKTVRSTEGKKGYQRPLHIISAQLSELGVTLASKSVEGKSNEIPAVQELLQQMDIEGCLVVADALNCQRETAKVIVSGKGDYLLSVKENQPSLIFEEDYLRVANKTIQENMNLLRKFALSMIRQYKSRIVSKRALSKLMFDCLLDPNMILRVLSQN